MEVGDDVLVIGGGAAGMIAAWRAACRGARARLLEKNPRLGLKIHISGGGKCNITHAGDMGTVREAFEPREARFLRRSFRRFTNDDVLHLICARGVSVHTRSDGRVFPDSVRAVGVVAALEWPVREAGASSITATPARRVLVAPAENGPRAAGVEAAGQVYPARTVILAVGGSSYPKTGTVGEGY